MGVESRATEVQGLRRAVERHLQVVIRQRAYEIGQQASRRRRRAFGGDLRGNDLSDADLKIRRGERKAVRGCLDEDVVEDRQRRPARDGP
jgi:hypothetical protein